MYCKKPFLFVLFILLTGCQLDTAYVSPVPAIHTIKLGSTLALNKPLTIPASLARVYLQAGEVRDEQDVDRYYPNCSLEVKTIKDSAQIISADNFKIIKMSLDEETALTRPLYASVLLTSFNEHLSDSNWVTHFYLQSKEQPDVYRLSCGHWEDPSNARHLTIQEITTTLGNYFTFQ